MRAIPNISSFERWSLESILDAIGQAPLGFVLKRGDRVSPAGMVPVADIVIRDVPTLLKMMQNPEIGFGDGYAEGTVEVEGDLAAALDAAYRAISTARHERWYTRVTSRWLE